MKNCKQCGKEFQPLQKKGHEQLYCTKTCARQAARIRHEQRLITKNSNNENRIHTDSISDKQYNENPDNINMGQQPTKIGTDTRYSITGNSIELLQQLYEVKNENNFLKYRIENLEKQLSEKSAEIMELQDELDSIDEEENSNNSGILAGVIDQFKRDPHTTINFVTATINDLLKPKVNEKPHKV